MRAETVIAFALLVLALPSAFGCSVTSLTAPSVLSPSNTVMPINIGTGTPSGDAFFLALGSANTGIYKYTRNTATTTLLAGTIGPSNVMVDGTGTVARFISVTAITFADALSAIYVIDSSTTIRKIDANTGATTTLLTDSRLSSTATMAVQGSTLAVASGSCVLTVSLTVSNPALSLLAGDCSVAASTFTSGQALTASLPTFSGIIATGQSYVVYSAKLGIFIIDPPQQRIATGPAITGTFAGFAVAGSTVVVFTASTCTMQLMQFTGTLPTVTTVVPTGTSATGCGGKYIAALPATPGASDSFIILFGGLSATLYVTDSTCGVSSSTATTTSAPSKPSPSSSSDNTSTIVIAVAVSVGVVVIAAIIGGVCVVLRRTPQPAPGPEDTEMQPRLNTSTGSASNANGNAIARAPSSDPTATANNTPFNSLPRPGIAGAANMAYPGFNSPGGTGGTVAAASVSFSSDRANETYPPKAVEPATPNGSVSTQKRALTNSQVQGQGLTLAAVSHSDFANSGMEVTESDIRRHNKRCEYVAAGAFQKGKLLGRGANGSVYAILLKDGSTIAMKEVNLIGTEEEIRAQMRDNEAEVNLLRQLHHPNLVTYYGIQNVESDLRMNIFMECVTGGSLGAMIRGMPERLSEETAQVFTSQIVKGLAFIHSHGIVHRDLKCDNILRDLVTGLIKLADFGTAKNVGNATNASRAAQTMIGTPYFMAPEILMSGMGESQDAGYGIKADVWSLGITIAEMLNRGVPPWPAFPSPGHAFLHISSPQGIPIMPEGLSADCQDFILRCTDRNPATRISSAELVLHPWIASVDA